MQNLKVGLLGGGSWGTTVASLMTRNVPVTLWARNPDTVREINEQRSNETYLPGAVLPEKLVATHDIGECVREADVVVTSRRFGNATGMLPYSVLIDAGGVVRWVKLGALERPELEEMIRRHLPSA